MAARLRLSSVTGALLPRGLLSLPETSAWPMEFVKAEPARAAIGYKLEFERPRYCRPSLPGLRRCPWCLPTFVIERPVAERKECEWKTGVGVGGFAGRECPEVFAEGPDQQ